jgi:CO/xanthine dehydrogenase Mo-binding subunit
MRYAADWHVPGTLAVAVARSTQVHARLTSVKLDAAREMDGVTATFSGADLRELLGDRLRTGPAFQDEPILAHDRVRYAGEPIAAVVAGDHVTARRAAAAIEAEYEPLEPVLDVDRAVAGPPFVHDELLPSKVFRDLAHLAGKRDTNVCYEFNLLRGDVDEALAASERVVEGEYWSSPIHHVPIELPSTLAWVENDWLELVSTTQTPSYVRQSLALMLDLPLNRVRVRVPHLGGGFGSKMYDRLEPLVAVLAWHLQRPLRFLATREEAFLLTTRHGVAVTMRMGADASGELTGASADVRYDTGAYADIGPRIAAKSGLVATGPYATPAARITSRCVYTNKPSAGAFRGFGVPQVVWAHECTIDELARELGRDPYEYRRERILEEGDEHAVGTRMHSADMAGCLDRVAEALEWSSPLEPGDERTARGRGVAVGLKAVLTPTISGAVVQLNQDASATVLASTVDMGQGSDTILAQIVAEVLAIDSDRTRVINTDTNVSPYDTITAGSRSTYHMGNTVRLAAEHVRDQLLDAAAAVLGADRDSLALDRGGVVREGEADPAMSIQELMVTHFGARGTTLTGEATFKTQWVPYDLETGQSEDVAEHWFAGAAGAELSVDRLTGRVTIDHLAVAGDVGRAINPRMVEQQLTGAALMGLGSALFEEIVLDEGRPANLSLLDYQMPSVRDLPKRITPIVVESAHRTGPYGAKGVGETGILALAPAIGNALRDALGVRLRRLPMTSESILEAIG